MTPREEAIDLVTKLQLEYSDLEGKIERLMHFHMAMTEGERESDAGILLADQGRTMTVYLQILGERINLHTPPAEPDLIHTDATELVVPGIITP